MSLDDAQAEWDGLDQPGDLRIVSETAMRPLALAVALPLAIALAVTVEFAVTDAVAVSVEFAVWIAVPVSLAVPLPYGDFTLADALARAFDLAARPVGGAPNPRICRDQNLAG